MTGQYRDTAGCTKADSRGGWIMKKAILCLSAALLMAAFSAAAAAAPTAGAPQNIVQQIRTADGQQGAAVEKNAQRPRVVVMYVNNAKSTYDAAVDKEIFKYINKALPADTYELMDGTPYVQKLNAQGYTDLSTAERADFMDAFAGSGIDYCIYLEITPFVARDKITLFTIGKDITTSVPFKIIDLSTGKYIYTGKFTEKASDSTIIGDIGNKSVALKALDSAGEKILSVIQTRLPKTKAAVTK